MHDPKNAAGRVHRPPRMGVRAIHGGSDWSETDVMHDPKFFQFRGGPGPSATAAGVGVVHAAELLASILADLGTIQSGINAGTTQSRLSSVTIHSTPNAGTIQSAVNPDKIHSATNAGAMQPALNPGTIRSPVNLGTIQSALNACRQSDEAGFQALDPGHPLAARGHLVRRHLWASLGLAERARQAAARAADSAAIYYGDEHPETGRALACLCESTSHRGPVDDSICDAIHSLAVRIKVGRPRYSSFAVAVNLPR